MRCIAAFYASAVAVGAGAPVASQPAEHPGCQDAPTETVTSTFRNEHAWPGALTKIDNCGSRIIADHVVRDPLGARDGLRVPDTVTRFDPNGAPPQQVDVTRVHGGARPCALAHLTEHSHGRSRRPAVRRLQLLALWCPALIVRDRLPVERRRGRAAQLVTSMPYRSARPSTPSTCPVRSSNAGSAARATMARPTPSGDWEPERSTWSANCMTPSVRTHPG
jgi:hypothetical protein